MVVKGLPSTHETLGSMARKQHTKRKGVTEGKVFSRVQWAGGTVQGLRVGPVLKGPNLVPLWEVN